MKLYIGNNAYNTRDQTFDYYGECGTLKEMHFLMNKYYIEKNFTSYYTRWIADKDLKGNPIWIVDFGSWTRFFYITELSGELLNHWNKLTMGALDEQTE